MKQVIALMVAMLMPLITSHVYADTAAASAAGSKSKPAVHSRSVAARKKTTSANEEPAVQASKPGSASTDRLNLDTTTVTGNRELPKVLYIVPWKKADVGNLPGQPFNTLLDEALKPVDREVFRREVEYYHAISNKDRPGNNDTGSQSATSAPAK
ncbi:MAG TPA: hypothetical protein VG962_10955 [Steroidobacteraceae bacterium]|nr:hypothetical protein [Steroidobacteraceae bacterium]